MPLFSVTVREHTYTGRFYSDVVQAGSCEEALQAAAEHAAVPWPPPGPTPRGEFDAAVTGRTRTGRPETGVVHAGRREDAQLPAAGRREERSHRPPAREERQLRPPGAARMRSYRPPGAARMRSYRPPGAARTAQLPAAGRREDAQLPAAGRREDAQLPAAGRREDAQLPAAGRREDAQLPAPGRREEAPETAAGQAAAPQPAPGPPLERGFSVAVREQAPAGRVYTEIVQAASSEEALLVAAELAAAPQPSPGPEPQADAEGRPVCGDVWIYSLLHCELVAGHDPPHMAVARGYRRPVRWVRDDRGVARTLPDPATGARVVFPSTPPSPRSGR